LLARVLFLTPPQGECLRCAAFSSEPQTTQRMEEREDLLRLSRSARLADCGGDVGGLWGDDKNKGLKGDQSSNRCTWERRHYIDCAYTHLERLERPLSAARKEGGGEWVVSNTRVKTPALPPKTPGSNSNEKRPRNNNNLSNQPPRLGLCEAWDFAQSKPSRI
jgi:hypothetical protein